MSRLVVAGVIGLLAVLPMVAFIASGLAGDRPVPAPPSGATRQSSPSSD